MKRQMPNFDGKLLQVFCPLCGANVEQSGSETGYIYACNTILWRQVVHSKAEHDIINCTKCWCGFDDQSYSGLCNHIERDHDGLESWIRLGILFTGCEQVTT